MKDLWTYISTEPDQNTLFREKHRLQ